MNATTRAIVIAALACMAGCVGSIDKRPPIALRELTEPPPGNQGVIMKVEPEPALDATVPPPAAPPGPVDLAAAIAELRVEVQRLRATLEALDKRTGGGQRIGTSPRVPQPDPADLEGGTHLNYRIITQWGRGPEEARETGAASLQGMVIGVPQWLGEAQLAALGRRLRGEFDVYDNINIKVFDDEKAARAYAARQASDSKHLVMTVTRHRESGQDSIIVLKGEAPLAVEWSP